ncbi:hypothetical protein JB92DRAFT_2896530 [Gautieria morchelliformis]|nr:hypothetical protein JB92DRAFT_2896530 [Gautieria morchelliformis]
MYIPSTALAVVFGMLLVTDVFTCISMVITSCRARERSEGRTLTYDGEVLFLDPQMLHYLSVAISRHILLDLQRGDLSSTRYFLI